MLQWLYEWTPASAADFCGVFVTKCPYGLDEIEGFLEILENVQTYHERAPTVLFLGAIFLFVILMLISNWLFKKAVRCWGRRFYQIRYWFYFYDDLSSIVIHACFCVVIGPQYLLFALVSHAIRKQRPELLFLAFIFALFFGMKFPHKCTIDLPKYRYMAAVMRNFKIMFDYLPQGMQLKLRDSLISDAQSHAK